MDIICDYSLCTACSACAGICPKGCISFASNPEENGHVFPQIDHSRCIDCGLCQHTCPAIHPTKLAQPSAAYASYSLAEKVCNTSSSGGVAYTLAQWIISRGGVVYGSVVEYGANFRICHKRIDNITDLHLSQSSKYVHSKIDREIYLEVKKDLQDGKEVLFTGTGCQIAGVRNFLKKNYSNFYAVDIICHGVPSLKMLTDYLSSRYDVSQIRQISFRSKTGFNIYGVYGVYGVKIDLPLPRNLYMMGFMKGLFYRPACYSCPFAQSQRGSDITLGDFWGLKAKFVDRPKTSKGTSVILINTEKGEKLLDVIKHDLALIERPIDEAIAGNPQLNHPSRRHYAYSLFRRLNPVLGFRTAAILSLVREKIFYAFALPLLNKISGK